MWHAASDPLMTTMSPLCTHRLQFTRISGMPIVSTGMSSCPPHRHTQWHFYSVAIEQL